VPFLDLSLPRRRTDEEEMLCNEGEELIVKVESGEVVVVVE
jgi:hypothetical protein